MTNGALTPLVRPLVRLIREVSELGGSGPWNGQYALQKALRARAPAWLAIGGSLRPGEIPWFWCWEDRADAAIWATAGKPFIVGPNILFADSRRPCSIPAERVILDAPSCRLLFTESAWYRELIERHRAGANSAPIVLWPYPIDPKPAGPVPAQYDLLIFVKEKRQPGLIDRLRHRVKRTRVLTYGRFTRDQLYKLARRSRCCLYLSTDDRGPLALAEILLSGCPAIGVPTGAPFIRPGRTGVLLERFHPTDCLRAMAACHKLDRRDVAAEAERQFDTQTIVDTILQSLITYTRRPFRAESSTRRTVRYSDHLKSGRVRLP